jgi:hypothetical protein
VDAFVLAAEVVAPVGFEVAVGGEGHWSAAGEVSPWVFRGDPFPATASPNHAGTFQRTLALQ